MHLARELLMNVQCSGGSRNFAKETRALKMRSAVASHLKLTTTIEKIFEADSLTTTGEVAEELNVGHSMSFGILKQIGKVKKLDKRGGPHDLTTNLKKTCHFEVSSSLILCNNSKPFLDQIVTCDEKWILYNNQRQPAQCLNGEDAPKHFPKPNLHQKKVMVTVWWSSVCLIHYSFLNPRKTITSEKYSQKIDETH